MLANLPRVSVVSLGKELPSSLKYVGFQKWKSTIGDISQVDPVVAFKGMFLIVALHMWLSTKQTRIISNSQVHAGALVRFKRVLVCLFIV